MTEILLSGAAIIFVSAVLGFAWTLLKASNEDWDNENF